MDSTIRQFNVLYSVNTRIQCSINIQCSVSVLYMNTKTYAYIVPLLGNLLAQLFTNDRIARPLYGRVYKYRYIGRGVASGWTGWEMSRRPSTKMNPNSTFGLGAPRCLLSMGPRGLLRLCIAALFYDKLVHLFRCHLD